MKKRISALQIGTKPQGTQATLEAILSFESAIKEAQTDLVVMPEALLGGYPKGEIFGTRLGYRLPKGRESFKQYFDEAIAVPGPETRELADLAARLNTNLVIGGIEKQGSTLYCTSLYFTPEDGLAAKHRKLMPTGTERLIWGQGDGSTLPAINTSAGRISGAICWENHMPLLRMALYGKGVDIWCAPTVDEREIWQCSMRHIAHEGRMFLVSACQVQPSPDALGIKVENWDEQRPLIAGGSVIVSPMGDILAGPLKNEEGLITADIDLEDLKRARYDFDVNGHYARPDVFSLHVDESEKRSVVYSG
ncbi:carbon-nitrogen hydrolase family protein [Alteromonas sp. NFXS44]|uniref:carbon-nitrogen hydrolase family protein n=1 Tax=Alteromonas sp. NFXS44 TaxID=2818435 RepID=UPI0032DF30FF